ncbi:MAG: DNA translocase FtsK [Bacteroidetes bacterium]|nr:DNA translocase FtsK [Bacteroidota bacterium]
MPSIKGNQFRNTNSFRGEPMSKPVSKQQPAKETAEDLPKFKLNDDRAIKIIGLFFLIISLYFMVAFTSYLFTWQDDQSYVIDANGGWSNLLKTQQELTEMGLNQPAVQNWLGKLGALLSHQFIYEWFGVASFLFIGIFFIIGYRMLFKVRVLSITKSLAYSFFLLIFISVGFAFFHAFINDYPHFLEGEFGFWTNRLLQAQIGDAGTAGLLIFTGLSALIIAYNIDFNLPKRSVEEQNPIPETNDEVELEEEVLYPPVELNLPNRPGHETSDADTNKLSQNLPIAEAADHPESEEHRSLVISPSRNVPFETSLAVSKELNDSPPLTIEKTEEEKKSTELVEKFGMYDPTLDLSSYKYPPLDLLENYGTNKIAVNSEELEANKNKIVETLNHYNIEIDKIKATIGPTVTLYEIIPAPGVRISKIKNLEDDIALSLAALGIRIIAPMPGKGTIGIEVPNQHPEMVSMRSVLATEKFQNTNMDLPIALGKTISNEVFIADLSKMPHLLVAGATGQGKSVGINAILISLLYKMHPSQLKFVLVDPKKVELTLFRKIERHFLAKLPGEADAIITDTKEVITTLNSLCIEMDLRYDLLKNAHVRNLKEYNQKFINRNLNPNEGHRFLPFIVLIIDEFADLMMTAGKEVETPIARIAQLARAVGIHLVIATQRPSVNIITGTIKANFPARLAFRVLSKIDSRTILDSGGADQLIGRGDMLLSTGSDLIRIQCAFVDTPEVEKVSEFIGSQRGSPSAWMLPEYLDENADQAIKDFDASERDPMFEEAARLIVMHQQGSTSLIQRKLKLGYNRAGRIIDQLEAAQIVGPFEGSKAREVLIPDEYSLEQFLNTLDKEDN